MNLRDFAALMEQATPGPWKVAQTEAEANQWWDRGDKVGTVVLATHDPNDCELPIACTCDDGFVTENDLANAAFIAACREMVPKLLAVVEAARFWTRDAETFAKYAVWPENRVGSQRFLDALAALADAEAGEERGDG